VIIPQGWTGDYDGWEPATAWGRSVALAKQADELGIESIWVFDHFHTVPRPTDEITFESFTMLSALAAVTTKVRLGHVVICTAFRNPALTAKMISTMDVISGGRMELGIGAGWKRDEWLAYGYGFPETRERLARLGDDLAVIEAMLGGDKHEHATSDGTYSSVRNAINVPKPIQRPRVPIMVGGNGPNVTWRLAVRHADELNLDGLSPAEVTEALPVIRSRCEEIGRDPATLSVSIHAWTENTATEGAQRVDLLAGYRETGIARLMTLIKASAGGDEGLESFAADARAAGLELAQSQ
jgi:F420-dependent oxidoreductase-like protein